LKNKFLNLNFYLKIFFIIIGTFIFEILFIFFLNFSLNPIILNFKKIFQESVLNLIFGIPFCFQK
jgi:hypothetical protein